MILQEQEGICKYKLTHSKQKEHKDSNFSYAHGPTISFNNRIK
jgi:hypothetical protein